MSTNPNFGPRLLAEPVASAPVGGIISPGLGFLCLGDSQ